MTRSVSFDRAAADYDRTRGGEERGVRYAAILDPLFGGRGLTLEVGVGTGIVARGLAALGRDVVGVDLSPAMLDLARTRLGSRVANGDAMKLPVRSEAVDDAYSVWVLHLVGDVAAVLAEVARVLRPGGRYLVVTSVRRTGDPIGEVYEELSRRLRGEQRGQDDTVRLEQAGAAARLRLRAVQAWEDFGFTMTPNAAVEEIEHRTHSYLWDLTDEQWRDVVVPALERLRSMPDPDTPIERRVVHDVVVLERLQDG